VFVYATPVVESACFGHGFSHTDTLAQLLTAGESLADRCATGKLG